ncbi:hypothetical protein Droror1_Dr00027036 [Drosera rotundifolia]
MKSIHVPNARIRLSRRYWAVHVPKSMTNESIANNSEMKMGTRTGSALLVDAPRDKNITDFWLDSKRICLVDWNEIIERRWGEVDLGL